MPGLYDMLVKLARRKDFAPGLPRKGAYGVPERQPVGQLLPWVIQRHHARRAGKHYDIRFGRGLMPSFATKKEMPAPGEKRRLFQQPLHREEYMHFEGEIPEGYGKGTVETAEKGEILITSTGPGRIVFTVAHKKFPERFALIRSRSNPREWILANITPTETLKYDKVRYAKIPAAELEQVLPPDYVLQPKVDGAAGFFRVLNRRLEALSYRTSKTGRPIIHTERMGISREKLPKELEGTILRGEIYGTRGGRTIPAQELGGILNASVAKALRKQKQQDVKLKGMIFGIRELGGKELPWKDMPHHEQMQLVRKVVEQLPGKQFHIPEEAKSPAGARQMYKRIQSGKHPLTSEGLVAYPVVGGRPAKLKFLEDKDVYIRKVFPGTGRLEGAGAGGFWYSLAPGGPLVGKVGTGFTEETRRRMFTNPEEFIGRRARIKTQGQFPSGAYRAPGFISLHEDY